MDLTKAIDKSVNVIDKKNDKLPEYTTQIVLDSVQSDAIKQLESETKPIKTKNNNLFDLEEACIATKNYRLSMNPVSVSSFEFSQTFNEQKVPQPVNLTEQMNASYKQFIHGAKADTEPDNLGVYKYLSYANQAPSMPISITKKRRGLITSGVYGKDLYKEDFITKKDTDVSYNYLF